MKLLALETATEACSCAVWIDGACHQAHAVAPQRHAELILDMADEVLAAAGLEAGALDAIAVGRGPGSFTGVRIAIAVAQGMASARGLPVVPVSTLRVLAQGALRRGGHRRVLAALDARMGEVYWGAFSASGDGRVMAPGEECVCRPEEVPLPSGGEWLGAGPGWAAHAGALDARLGGRVGARLADALPEARDLAALAVLELAAGAGVEAAAALPVYLRDTVVRG